MAGQPDTQRIPSGPAPPGRWTGPAHQELHRQVMHAAHVAGAGRVLLLRGLPAGLQLIAASRASSAHGGAMPGQGPGWRPAAAHRRMKPSASSAIRGRGRLRLGANVVIRLPQWVQVMDRTLGHAGPSVSLGWAPGRPTSPPRQPSPPCTAGKGFPCACRDIAAFTPQYHSFAASCVVLLLPDHQSTTAPSRQSGRSVIQIQRARRHRSVSTLVVELHFDRYIHSIACPDLPFPGPARTTSTRHGGWRHSVADVQLKAIRKRYGDTTILKALIWR